MSVQAALKPGEQARNWKRRWREIQAELQRLLTERTETLSGDAIMDAQRQLLAFYVHAYHLKDALKAEAAKIGVSKAQIEGAISAEAALSLLADLANLDKHFILTQPPRSGYVSQIGEVQGSQSGSGEGGWQLEQVIEHNGQELDGLTVARDAVDAWERCLTNWGLLPGDGNCR